MRSLLRSFFINAVAIPECNDTDVRLVHGESPREGVVEICFGGKWGSVCNNEWDESDAAVVCGQLGFSRQGEEGSILVYSPEILLVLSFSSFFFFISASLCTSTIIGTLYLC